MSPKPPVKRKRVSNRPCTVCAGSLVLSWRNAEDLKHYLSPRGRILPRTVTGICAKHQRHLANIIKHCRQLALLPFVTGLD